MWPALRALVCPSFTMRNMDCCHIADCTQMTVTQQGTQFKNFSVISLLPLQCFSPNSKGCMHVALAQLATCMQPQESMCLESSCRWSSQSSQPAVSSIPRVGSESILNGICLHTRLHWGNLRKGGKSVVKDQVPVLDFFLRSVTRSQKSAN